MISFFVDSDCPIRIPDELKPEVAKYRKMGKKLHITISPVLQPRTMAQNAIFHAKVNEIAHLTGWDRDEVKKDIKNYAMQMGYPPAMSADGDVEISPEGELIPLPSHKATIEQMELLIEALYSWCFEKGVNIQEER